MAERTHVAVAGPRLAECGTNTAGSLTTGRPCGPTFAQINREGPTESGGEGGRQSSGQHPMAPHASTDKPDKRRGAKQTTQPRAPAQGNNASNLRLKTPVGVGEAAGETPSLTGEVVGETHRGLGRAQAHPLRNQHQRGPV